MGCVRGCSQVCEGMLTVQAAADQQNALSTEGTRRQLGLAVMNTTPSLRERELCFSEGMQNTLFSIKKNAFED